MPVPPQFKKAAKRKLAKKATHAVNATHENSPMAPGIQFFKSVKK